MRPASEAEVRDCIAAALGAKTPLEIRGAGTKRALGRALDGAQVLDMAGLSAITLYEPDELVLRALPGTPLAEVQARLARHGQMLAFEPPDYAALLGARPGAQTIGGVVACNLSGPRRVRAGAARDHFLGFRAVSGRAEIFKAGGRVVKNVTGYDLCKLMAGSYGTLAALTEITLKVLPAPETVRTVAIHGLDDRRAAEALGAALASAHEVSGAAHLPDRQLTALRLEGFDASVAARCRALIDHLAGFGACDVLDYAASLELWRAIADVGAFAKTDRAVWRVSVPPAAGPKVAAAVQRAHDARALYDWGGGLVWLEVAGDATRAVRAAVRGIGHATLIRGRHAAPFEPEPPGIAALTARIKDAFDPARILNPGRMYEGV